MKSLLPILIAAVPLASLATLVPLRPGTGKTARAMRVAASGFLDTLTPEQKSRATFPLSSDERENWHFVPIARKGLPLKDMEPKQRDAATNLLKTGLSKSGISKVETIRSLENVLKEIEKGSGPTRDSDAYFVSVFGTPDDKQPWGWRFEGHHFSVNFTLVGEGVSASPAFYGSNPATVRIEHPMKGVRALSGEEDAARALLNSLTDAQKSEAIIEKDAPNDILSFDKRKAEALAPGGLPAGKLTKAQKPLLRKLIAVYAGNMVPELAKARQKRIATAGEDKLVFAWAGSVEVGKRHYYRVQGPTALIEYDNTQNDANHIHSVWRDFDGDFGRDLLAEHLKAGHPRP